MTLNHTINFEKYSYDKNILGTTVQVLKNGMHWGLIKLIQKSPSKLRRRFILRCLASITEFLLDIIIFRYFRSYISHSAEVLRFWSKIFDIFSEFPGFVFMEGSMYRYLQQIGARVAFTCLDVFVPTTFGPKLGVDCQTEFPKQTSTQAVVRDASSLIDSLSVVRCGDNEKQTRVEGTKQHKVSKNTNTVIQNISQEKTIEPYKTSKNRTKNHEKTTKNTR